MSINDFSIASHTPMSGLRAGTLQEPMLNMVRRGVARMKHRRRRQPNEWHATALLGDVAVSQQPPGCFHQSGRLPERRHADD